MLGDKTPMFTKRHYIALANVLKARSDVVEGLIDLFQWDNPQFNQQLFRQAVRGGI